MVRDKLNSIHLFNNFIISDFKKVEDIIGVKFI